MLPSSPAALQELPQPQLTLLFLQHLPGSETRFSLKMKIIWMRPYLGLEHLLSETRSDPGSVHLAVTTSTTSPTSPTTSRFTSPSSPVTCQIAVCYLAHIFLIILSDCFVTFSLSLWPQIKFSPSKPSATLKALGIHILAPYIYIKPAVLPWPRSPLPPPLHCGWNIGPGLIWKQEWQMD